MARRELRHGYKYICKSCHLLLLLAVFHLRGSEHVYLSFLVAANIMKAAAFEKH